MHVFPRAALVMLAAIAPASATMLALADTAKPPDTIAEITDGDKAVVRDLVARDPLVRAHFAGPSAVHFTVTWYERHGDIACGSFRDGPGTQERSFVADLPRKILVLQIKPPELDRKTAIRAIEAIIHECDKPAPGDPVRSAPSR